MNNDQSKSKKKAHKADTTEIETLKNEIAELTLALQRERADAMNVRRRADEERLKLASVHKSSVIRQMLPVIDNFERSLKHIPADLESNDYIKGIEGIVKQFESTLADLGVQRIATVGHEFNPHLHEAVQMEEGEGNREVVHEELQSGYKIDDEVLRPAIVKVKNEK